MAPRGNTYYAVFSCGHKANIYYFGKSDFYKKLTHAENEGLCPDCKRKEFKKTAVKREIPYSVYKELLQKKRNVIAENYQKGKITVYMTEKVDKWFENEYNKVFLDIENAGYDDNRNKLVAIFVKGYNTFRLKDELKKLGYRFDGEKKRWQKIVAIFPDFLLDGSETFLKEKNAEFYAAIQELEHLGCKRGITLFTKKIC